MTLCLEAGRLDYKQALSEITAEELQGWLAYESLNGLGPTRDDVRQAYHTSVILQSKGAEVPASDLMYDVHSNPEEDQAEYDPITVLAMAFGCSPPIREAG